MPNQLRSGALETPVTDFPDRGILDGTVTSLKILDPTEHKEKTSLLEVNDPFDVELRWELKGAATTVTGGSWIVTLYSNDMDGVGQMTGPIDGPHNVAITGGVAPLKFEHVFHVRPPTPKVGLYQLTATINHSPTGNPRKTSEMFGYAESTPIDIRDVTVESEGSRD
jgi:hypothetical protein